MKNIMKLLVVLMVSLSTQSFAQTFKFGHINMSELIALMPDRDSAAVKLEKYGKDLEETLQVMDSDLRKKYEEYTQKEKEWLPAILEAKQKELGEMQQRMQQYQQNAQQTFEETRQKLFAPVIQKANEAVDKIGKDNGFTYIFDVSAGALIYVNENVSENILPLAKKALGIPADKKLPVQGAGAAM